MSRVFTRVRAVSKMGEITMAHSVSMGPMTLRPRSLTKLPAWRPATRTRQSVTIGTSPARNRVSRPLPRLANRPVMLVRGPVSHARSHSGTTEARRLILVDFTGEGLAEVEALRTQLSVSPGAITANRLYRYPERKTVRVAFELDPRGEKACELRLALLRDDTALTETWLYRWTP